MKIYRSYNELYLGTLQLGDILEFIVDKRCYCYIVTEDHLKNLDIYGNSVEIFCALDIHNIIDFCQVSFGYLSTSSFKTKDCDYKALTKLALALFKKCYEKSNIENNTKMKSTDFDYNLIDIRQSKILNTIDSKINKVRGELCLTEKESYEAVINLYEMDNVEECSRFINKYLNAKREQEKWEHILHNLNELKSKLCR
ncbi:MAG: hypothetical protein RR406_04895 [Bacilli bacterium]